MSTKNMRMTFKTWCLYKLRNFGLYKGPINFVMIAKPFHFNISGKGFGR